MIRKFQLWGINLTLSAVVVVAAVATAYAGLEAMIPVSVDSQDMLVGLLVVSALKDTAVSGVLAYLP